MEKPEILGNEAERLGSLCSLNLLDTSAEERFDRYTRMAKRYFGVSIALVSLVDAERQWFKSRQGLAARETPRDISFCGHAILGSNIFHIPDTLKDPRFIDNPLVTGPPNIRFYAGAPLQAPDGQRIGTLCIIDDKPREFSANELAMLRDLADGVEEELKHSQNRVSGKAQKFHPIAGLGFILGGLLSLLLFSLSWQVEEDEILLQLQTQADERRAALAVEAESLSDIMRGIAGMYNASNHVDADEFDTFLKTAFPNQTEIRAAVWIEHVAEDKVADMYSMATRDGYTNYQIRDLVDDNVVKAAPRAQYLPVYHNFNRDQTQWLPRGLNLASIPHYDELLKQAATTGGIVSTRGTGNFKTSTSNSIELFLPVYHLQKTLPDGAFNKTRLRGFVGMHIDVAQSVESAYRRKVIGVGGLDFYIVDIDSRRKQSLLHFHPSRARKEAVSSLPLEKLQQGRYVSTEIDFADTRWRLVLRPIQGYHEVNKVFTPWAVLFGGLLFSLMVAIYLNSLRSRRDIIEEQVRQRTRELEDSREQNRAILSTVIDGIITINQKGIVQSVNPAAEKIFGYSSGEVIGRNINMLMPESYSREHDGYLYNYITTGLKKVIGIGREVEGLRKDASVFPMELAVSEMELNGERMFTGIVRDITERKRAERVLQDALSRQQTIQNTMVDGLITVSDRGVIDSMNHACSEIFGYTEEELIGQSFTKLLTSQAGSMYADKLQNYLRTGEKTIIGQRVETEGVTKDGSVIPLEFAINEMWLGETRYFTTNVRDITERKRLDRMKSEFISTVSHELRTPLTSIRGSLGLILGKSADLLPEKSRRMLELAARNSERLTLLINDILDLEKIETGRMEFELANVDLLALARQAVVDNEGYATQHHVSLKLISSLDHAFIQSDAHRLLQVFANLISNAVKYSPDNGVVEISVTKDKATFCVSVSDKGQGIPDEFRNRIFQRFAQADSSSTRQKGGTGLGLSITKAIVECFGGSIGYDSQLGEGTRFYFNIPVWQPTQENIVTSATAVHVLICEDNPDVAEIIAEMLKVEGVVSDIAATAGDARRLLEKNTYRLLLLDLTLPDMDGLQFLQELRAAPETARLPVIVVSGRAEEGRTAFNGDALTVVDWLQKPIDPVRLDRALQEALTSNGRPHILHVEDDPDIVQITSELLGELAEFSYAPSVREARQLLAKNQFNLVILDLGLADGSGVELLDELKGNCPVVIFSAQNPDAEITKRVTAALTKSMTSNEQLLVTIKKVLAG